MMKSAGSVKISMYFSSKVVDRLGRILPVRIPHEVFQDKILTGSLV
jgi:hypothetical protein